MALYLSEEEAIDLERFNHPDWFETNIKYNYEPENYREILFNYTNANVTNLPSSATHLYSFQTL